MIPVSSKGGGECIGPLDVCLVPATPSPLPTPFVNVALCRDAEATSAAVLAENKEVLVESSVIPMSTGDEAGSAGGVVSGMIRGPAQFKTSSAAVRAGGKRVVHHMSVTSQNGTNANVPTGIQATPSQSKVFVLG